MPNYFYTAKSSEGKTETGVLEARDERQLAQFLKNTDMVLVKAVPEEQAKLRSFNVVLFSRISLSEKIMMTRNLWVMVSSSLSLVKSFDILETQTKNAKLKGVLSDIRQQISKGTSVSAAMEKHPDVFSEFYTNMVKLGEEAGTLSDVFEILSVQLGKEHELRSKIQNAMIYPCIILVVMAAIGGIVITFVLPSLNTFFSTMSVPLPFYTKALLAFGAFLQVRWYLMLIVPFGIAALVWGVLRTRLGKRMFDGLLLKTPFFGSISRKSNSASLIRSLSAMTTSGVSLIRSLEITTGIVGNVFFKEALVESVKKIKRGERLSQAFVQYRQLFPIGIIEMIEVGEETGKTSVILKKLAEFYEEEAATAIEKISIIIEPMLIVGLGLSVAVFAISIIQPMYGSLSFIK